ncbi:Spc98 family-domain-containing protein [Neohortaea acidophila]|uniref:Spindle pole body component n=1 Tax=Neohortaea acidophila TaxID=245834 RepID=A0A6A6PGX8_9PEZI|nr:Spc98 family-domain-containing protein [Neohortaea acidophila]KAF2478873.1 Spc98 family-domain-containing protein [Neohortaea acidophila]
MTAAVSPSDQENRANDRAGEKRKTATVTTTTTETQRNIVSQEAAIRRTLRSPLKPTESNSIGRQSRLSNSQPSKSDSPYGRKVTPAVVSSSWSPQATLLPPSTAPLASRISVPPLASHVPEALRPKPLNSLSLAEQETAIIEDLLFVFMGFEGNYIRYTDTYQPLDEKSRLSGPDFRIENGLDPSLRDLAHSMLKTATHYCAVEAFVEVQSREDFGSVNHALCAAMRKLLKDYLILIAQLEHQLLTNSDFTLHQLSLHTKQTSHMMLQLYTVANEVLRENSMLDNPDDSLEADDEFENILESLREGRDTALPGAKKVCKGGSILRLIGKRLSTMSGDPAARQLLTTLLREASRPYMAMLNEWLHHGNVRDPHGEFLIKEQKSIRREGLEQDYTDEYWEKRYTIRPDLMPSQLEGVKEKVLLAGKYLNVVRECGGIANPNRDLDASTDVPHTFDDPRFLENVSGAYAFANRSLMSLLLTTHALPARLKSLKHYFFLDRSDFFSYFLELTHSELKKPAKNVNVSKLQSLLDIVLRQPGSVAAEDPFKEDVKVVMNDVGLTGWLMRVVNVQGMDADATTLSTYTPAPVSTSGDSEKDISGYEALTLDYAVPFPLSLVVSRVTLTRYQLLFRYLLSLRHLETLLTSAWTEHNKVPVWTRRNKTKDAHAKKVEDWKRRAWCLRSRMLCFVQQLLYFCTSEVIEPNWVAFMSRLNQEEEGEKTQAEGQSQESGAGVKRTVDELMQDHVDFLATCLKECMLTNSKLLRINSKVMATCTMFANYTSSLSRYLAAADPESPKPSSSIQHDPAKLDKLFSILQQYEDHFSRHLKILLDALNYLAATETVVFLGLCARLSMANEGGPRAGGGVVGLGESAR